MDFFSQLLPTILDAVHVWALAIADFFRGFGVEFPPAAWGTNPPVAAVTETATAATETATAATTTAPATVAQ